jgi:hypothetical protein
MRRDSLNRLCMALVATGLVLVPSPSWAAPRQNSTPAGKSAVRASTPGPVVQTPVPPTAPATEQKPDAGQKPSVAKPGAAPVPPPVQDGYSYRAEGRRDPFVSLLNRGIEPGQRRAEGVAGMLAGDVVLRGILQNRGTYLAIVQGPDGKRQYIVHPNDRFADGVVKAITADSMLILQDVNDPLSLTKQREIRKTLRAVEEVK